MEPQRTNSLEETPLVHSERFKNTWVFVSDPVAKGTGITADL